MATKKITITIERDQFDRIQSLVGSGKAKSVSGFVQHAVGVALDDVAGWGMLIAQALADSGGAVSPDEQAWADEILGASSRINQTIA